MHEGGAVFVGEIPVAKFTQSRIALSALPAPGLLFPELALGRGVVAISASPDIPIPEVPVPETPVTPSVDTPFDPGSPSLPDTGSFADPVLAPTAGTGQSLTPTAPTTEPISVSLGTGIGVIALLALLLQPFLGEGLARVAAVQLGTDEQKPAGAP